jgi:hypothetical protein
MASIVGPAVISALVFAISQYSIAEDRCVDTTVFKSLLPDDYHGETSIRGGRGQKLFACAFAIPLRKLCVEFKV